jgi:hypothetical protein
MAAYKLDDQLRRFAEENCSMSVRLDFSSNIYVKVQTLLIVYCLCWSSERAINLCLKLDAA